MKTKDIKVGEAYAIAAKSGGRADNDRKLAKGIIEATGVERATWTGWHSGRARDGIAVRFEQPMYVAWDEIAPSGNTNAKTKLIVRPQQVIRPWAEHEARLAALDDANLRAKRRHDALADEVEPRFERLVERLRAEGLTVETTRRYDRGYMRHAGTDVLVALDESDGVDKPRVTGFYVVSVAVEAMERLVGVEAPVAA